VVGVTYTQDNGSNAVEGDTEDDSSVTNRQQIGSNDTQGTNATATVDEPGNNDTHIAEEQGTNDTPMVDEPGINDTPTTDEPGINDIPTTDQPGNNDTHTDLFVACLLLRNHLLYLFRLH
jgi:hypothetical protein